MKRIVCIAFLAMLFLMSCSLAPVEKSVKVSKVSIVGNASEYIRVVEGEYTFKPVENNVYVAVKFKLLKEYSGNKPSMGNISLIPQDNTSNAIPDIGLNFKPATMDDYDKIGRLLKSKVGEQVTINFEWNYFSNSEKQKRILEGVNSFEIVDADISETESTQTQTSSSIKVSSNDWDKMLNDYEEFVSSYVVLYKKAMKGDNSAIQEYPALLEKAESLQESLTNAQNKGALSTNQINRLLVIQQKLTNAISGSN